MPLDLYHFLMKTLSYSVEEQILDFNHLNSVSFSV